MSRLSSRFTQVVLLCCLVVPVVVVVLGGGVWAWKWWGSYACEVVNIAPISVTQSFDTADVIKRVRVLMVVPPDEPVVTTLQQVNNLKATNQRVYQDAEEGDQLLLFQDRAVIYSPTRDKIVNVIAIQASSSIAPAIP